MIILQRTDIKGPAELKREEQKAKRQAKKETAEVEAAQTLEKAGIKPARSKVPAKRPVKKAAVAA